MRRDRIRITAIAVLLFSTLASKDQGDQPYHRVRLVTNDTLAQKIFNRAEELAATNIARIDGRKVMTEGAHYHHLWLETQPMGGYMYAPRDPEVARNNIEIFIDFQREDGRFPGVIYNRNGSAEPNYVQFQGFCFARPALELYFLTGADKAYLKRLYTVLEKFDTYLWRTRDSDSNGCLETWCIYDTGEDQGVRFNGFPNGWSFDFPPSPEASASLTPGELRINCKQDTYDSTRRMIVPIESMDIMSYSYSCREVLAEISEELENGMEKYWHEKAGEVRKRIREYLWDEGRSCCLDRDRDNKVMPILLHNNLRCMYFGSFDQEMADRFISEHLMNPDEFMTPMPLPSVAANDPMFRNISGNNWSGQPQGLTFQRSIRALENYGHYAELTIIGQRFLEVIGKKMIFTQQYDPFTTEPTGLEDGYGPTLLASLEFITRLYGIHITGREVYWSCLDNRYDYDYMQMWNGKSYRMRTNKKNEVLCFVNGKRVLTFTRGVRVVTDQRGNVWTIAGIGCNRKTITVRAKKTHKLAINPDEAFVFNADHQVFVKKENTSPE
jgi:hypothetical protein